MFIILWDSVLSKLGNDKKEIAFCKALKKQVVSRKRTYQYHFNTAIFYIGVTAGVIMRATQGQPTRKFHPNTSKVVSGFLKLLTS